MGQKKYTFFKNYGMFGNFWEWQIYGQKGQIYGQKGQIQFGVHKLLVVIIVCV